MKAGLVALGIALGAVGGTGVAVAATSGTSAHVCAGKHGAMRLATTCAKGERGLTLGAQGPQGAQGPAGVQGPAGPAGPGAEVSVTSASTTTHETVAGTFVVTATCPSGYIATGGGGYSPDDVATMKWTAPGETSWSSAFVTTGAASLTTTAKCLSVN